MDQDSTNGGPPPAAGSLHLFADNLNGFLLAVAFIGAGFIVKKQGLRRAGASGSRAGVGGYGYLLKPLWRIGMVTNLYAQLSPKMFWHIQGNGEMGKLEDNDMSSGEFVAVLRQSEDYVTLVYRLTRRMMDPEFSPNHAMQVYVGLNFMIDG
nr:PREDICTED: uncharacterized protein LOC103973758 isoform X1 [Musa acuminata subsp. malaccensis]